MPNCPKCSHTPEMNSAQKEFLSDYKGNPNSGMYLRYSGHPYLATINTAFKAVKWLGNQFLEDVEHTCPSCGHKTSEVRFRP